MSDSQAADFVSKWTVVDQFSGALGLSATVFQKIASGQRYLAIRGSESPGDFGANYILANGFPSQLNPQFASLRGQIDLWTASGVLPDTFTVTGHSLGGYLANAVALQFFGRVSSVHTYNAPGVDGLFSPVVDALRSAVGISGLGTLSTLTNVRGTAGWSLIAGLGNQIAIPMLIETESSLNPFANHSIVGLTDSLALYDLYARLAPNLDTGETKALIQSASATVPDSLERALDQLRAVFLGESARTTGKTVTGDRDQFYTNLKALTHSPAFTVLAGNATVALADSTLSTKAKTDFASFLSLNALSPIVISTSDATAIAKLKQANETLAQQWEADQTATQAQKDAGQQNFTSNWYSDRAALLQAIVTRNKQDNTNGLIYDVAAPIDRALALQFYEAGTAQQQTLFFQRQGGAVSKEQRIIFGNDNANTIDGSDINQLGDHLYGGAGNDTLTGLSGNDYIEGGADNDTLKGGDGQDTLLGGTGDDKLDGGQDSDILNGGAGTDTYNGDQRAPLNGSGNYDWGATNWLANGTLSGGVAEAGFADVISGTAGNDEIAGLGLGDCDNKWQRNYQKQHIQYRLGCSSTQNAHARSMRLAEHKVLGRRMDVVQTILGNFYLANSSRVCA